MQQLKKSYSLSDLTGENGDENRNTSHMHDETDMEGCWPIIAALIRASSDLGICLASLRLEFNRSPMLLGVMFLPNVSKQADRYAT